MGNIFLVMGKSATGKDHIYKSVLAELRDELVPVVTYTTRPIRENEKNGVEYNFVSVSEMEKLKAAGKVVESRCYHTMKGDWYYFTCDDGQIDTGARDSIMIVTPEAYAALRDYYGNDVIRPIYIVSADADRLRRSIKREEKQAEPNYSEVCRRYLADEQDFSPERLKELGITVSFLNDNYDECVYEIVEYIKKEIAKQNG